jgi:hypothetical protein
VTAKKPAPAAARANKVEVIAFKPVVTEVIVGGQKRRASYVPLIELNEDGSISLLCTLTPRIVESVLIMMQQATAEGKPMGPGVARKIGETITEDINARSNLVKIDRIVLMPMHDLPRDVISASSRGCERVEVDLRP